MGLEACALLVVVVGCVDVGGCDCVLSAAKLDSMFFVFCILLWRRRFRRLHDSGGKGNVYLTIMLRDVHVVAVGVALTSLETVLQEVALGSRAVVLVEEGVLVVR